MTPELEGERPVPVGDVEIAERIAQGARRGGPADRTPTLGQLMAAFSEPEPSPAARRRVRAALELAGVRVTPDVMDAEPGQRVTLQVGRSRSLGRAVVLGVGALGIVIGGAVLAASLGGSSGGDKASDSLPATAPASISQPTTQTTATTDTTSTAPTATATTPAATETTTVGTTTATTTTTSTARKRSPKKKTKKKKAAARPKTVKVRLRPSSPTFLCAKDGNGKVLFSGTLSSPRTFTARRVLLNVGLGSTTTVTVNGKRVALSGSPAGLDVTRTKRTPLGTGQRPEC